MERKSMDDNEAKLRRQLEAERRSRARTDLAREFERLGLPADHAELLGYKEAERLTFTEDGAPVFDEFEGREALTALANEAIADRGGIGRQKMLDEMIQSGRFSPL
jgi:hypothetical protein